MRISNINNANFKGLWEINKAEKKGTMETMAGSIPVLERKATYHPFRDETIDEIAEVMSKVDNVHEARYYGGIKHYILTEHYLGHSLQMTKEAYEEISDMKEDDKPVYEGYGRGYINYVPRSDIYQTVKSYKK